MPGPWSASATDFAHAVACRSSRWWRRCDPDSYRPRRVPDGSDESVAALRRRHGTHIGELWSDSRSGVGSSLTSAIEWRRLVAELLGTFLLVLVGAGAGVLDAKTGTIGRVAAVSAPACW